MVYVSNCSWEIRCFGMDVQGGVIRILEALKLLVEENPIGKSCECFLSLFCIVKRWESCYNLSCDKGRFPFDQKFRTFRLKSEWKGHFPESHFGILGVPIFRKIGITGKFCSIRPFLLGSVSPRPKLSTWLPQCSNVPNPEKRRLVL